MTLVEMIVALGVIGILLIPLAGTFYTAQSTDAQNRSYGDAVALANSALAKDDALAWTNLGFYEKQFSPFTCGTTIPSYTPPGGTTQSGVDLGCAPVAPNTADVLPVDTSPNEVVGNVQYKLTTYVVWAVGSGSCSGFTSCAKAEKQVYAVVSWSLGGSNFSATQNIIVYPGGLGAYNGGGQEAPLGSSPPPSVTGLGVVSGSLTYNSVQLQWNDPGSPQPGWYEIVAQNSSSLPQVGLSGTDDSWDPVGAQVVGSVAAPASSELVSGLAANSTYYFVVVAFSPDGTKWAVSSSTSGQVNTPSSPPGACQLTSLTVNQTGQTSIDTVTVKKTGGTAGHLMKAVTIVVGFTGSCTSSNQVLVSATGPAALGPYTLTYTSAPAQFSYNPPSGLCPSSAFATGNYVFSVKLDGTSQTPTANVPFSSVNGVAQC